MMRSRHHRPPRGLTLLEVIMSIAIIVVMMSAMLTFLWQFMEGRRHASLAAEEMLIARSVLEKVASELRGCVGFDEVGFPMEQGQRLLGDRRSISFLTLTLPEKHQYEFDADFETPLPAQHDLRQVSYSLWVDEDNVDEEGEPIVGGIIRTEKKTLNQFLIDEDDPLTIRNDLWSHELGYLEFRYFDGVEWTTEWNITEGISLPQLIQVTVGFRSITQYELDDDDLTEYPIENPDFALGDDLPHSDRYSVLIKIVAADKLFSSRIQRVGQQMSEGLGIGGLGP